LHFSCFVPIEIINSLREGEKDILSPIVGYTGHFPMSHKTTVFSSIITVHIGHYQRDTPEQFLFYLFAGKVEMRHVLY
jgi:hypothetical protein